METLLKADIFFFVTTIAVVLAVLVFVVIGIYSMRALHSFRKLIETFEGEVSNAGEHVKDIAEDVRGSFIYNLIFAGKRRRKKNEK